MIKILNFLAGRLLENNTYRSILGVWVINDARTYFLHVLYYFRGLLSIGIATNVEFCI